MLVDVGLSKAITLMYQVQVHTFAMKGEIPVLNNTRKQASADLGCRSFFVGKLNLV